MRSKKRFNDRVKLLAFVIVVAIPLYVIGFANGQASVYEKAQNDSKFYEEVFGK